MLDFLFIVFIILLWCCICGIKHRQREEDESGAHADLARLRETMSQRRRGGQPSTPSQDPEEQRKEREELVKSSLFSRKLEEGDSVSSLRSVLSATKEQYSEGSKKGNFISRSWRAATSSVRTLTRQECTICLDKYEKGDTVCWSKKDECDHIFHEGCISQWLHDHDDCPLCRANLIKGDDVDGDGGSNENEE